MNRLRLLALALPLCWASYATANVDELIPDTTATLHGLKRAWFAQVEMDRARSRLVGLLLDRGALFAQTDRGLVQAFDAETGRPLWASAKQVGNPDFPSSALGANEKVVAVANGTRLYVLNRFTGEILLEREVEGIPSAGVAVSQQRVFVPMLDGMIRAYRLKPMTDPLKELNKAKGNEPAASAEAENPDDYRLSQQNIAPLPCKSFGQTLVQPVVTRQTEDSESLAWPTDRGLLCVGSINRSLEDHFTMNYRLETGGEIAASPTYLYPKTVIDAGTLFVGSRDGFAYAVNDKTGASLWRFPVGQPVIERLGLIGQNLYVPRELGGMFCLDAASGTQKWFAPLVSQFVAASVDRLYVADRLGDLEVLDPQSGSRLDSIPIGGLNLRLCNLRTDRIYLADGSGMIQCLREDRKGAETLIQWVVEPKEEKAAKVEKKPPPKPKEQGEKPGEAKPEHPVKKAAPAAKPAKPPANAKKGKKGPPAADAPPADAPADK